MHPTVVYQDMASPTNPKKVLVFAGSNRSDSLNRKLAYSAASALNKTGIETTVIDLREFALPIYDGDLESEDGLPLNAKRLKAIAKSHDGFVLSSPEYNGSFPALLKNTLDWISRPEPGEGPLSVFRGKTAAILSASPGPGGGQRCLRQLKELLEMMGMNVAAQASVPKALSAFSPTGQVVRAETAQALETLAADFAQAIGVHPAPGIS